MEMQKVAVLPVEEQKKKRINSNALQQVLAFASLIVLILIFSISSSNFFQFDNIIGILLSTAVVGILALGATMIIVTSGIDLSVGTVLTLSSVMTGVFAVNLGFPVWAAVIGGIVTGAVTGLVSGTAIAKLKIPPFIATLAMMMIAKGLALVISKATPIYFTSLPSFNKIAMGSIIPGSGIPNAIFIFFGMAILASLILNKTIIGRYTFALGSNEEATRLSGVNVNKWKVIIYMIAGAFTGVAGIVMASRLNSAQPALGAGYELEAIAAVVIGGTSLSGGKGTILGTVIGALIMSVLTNGLQILSVPQEWQTVVVGAVILLAVYTDVLRNKKSAK
ncbi:ABC transporter permease [Neobacillus sp. 3P2-tot-E-2]|uniref:ABC transporter permease n=1 Tax=Neobacillus sp. 3P2-tot-E-2 TaxID=3132212 RepID=UPI0039A2F06C